MIITIIGQVCIDNNISENSAYTTAGGPAIFMSKIYGKFPDVTTHVVSPYGSDFVRYIKGINIFPNKPTHDWTLIYENKSQGNMRSQKTFNRECTKPLPINPELQKIISSSNILFFTPLTSDYSIQYIKELIGYTQPNSLRILLPQGFFRSFDEKNNVIQRDFIEADAIISLFNFVIVSEQDHQQMQFITHDWAKKTHIIMTLGEKGSCHMFKNESHFIPTEQVMCKDVIDSVGSGDIFSASFGYKYYLTKDIEKSLLFANNIARQCLFYPPHNLQFVLPEQ